MQTEEESQTVSITKDALNRLRTDLSQAQRRITELEIDAMTGLLRREVLFDRMQRLINRSSPLCILLVDVDDLKRHNTEGGMLAGDAAIRLVAEAITGSMRASCLAGRIGGDEFLVAAVGCSLEVGERLATRIRTACAQRSRGNVTCTTAVRLAYNPQTIEPRINEASRAIEASKRQRRAGVAIPTDPLDRPESAGAVVQQILGRRGRCAAAGRPTAEAVRILTGCSGPEDVRVVVRKSNGLLLQAAELAAGPDNGPVAALAIELGALVCAIAQRDVVSLPASLADPPLRARQAHRRVQALVGDLVDRQRR